MNEEPKTPVEQTAADIDAYRDEDATFADAVKLCQLQYLREIGNTLNCILEVLASFSYENLDEILDERWTITDE